MNQIWTAIERDFIRTNAGKMTDEKMASELTKRSGRFISKAAARKQRQKMNLKKHHGRGVCKLVGVKQEEGSVGDSETLATKPEYRGDI